MFIIDMIKKGESYIVRKLFDVCNNFGIVS